MCVCVRALYLVVCVHTVHIQCSRVFTKPIWCSLGAHWIKAVALTHSHTYTSTPSIPFSTCFGIFVHTLDLPVQFSFVLGKLTNALLSNLLFGCVLSPYYFIYFFVSEFFFLSQLYFVVIFLSGVPVECVLCVLWHLIPILLKPKLDDYFDILLDKIKKYIKKVNGDSECLELQRRLSSNCCKLERKKKCNSRWS